MGFLKAILRSKKAGAAVLGSLAKILVSFGLDPSIADAIVQLMSVYIASQAVVDVGLAVKGAKKE